MHVHSVSTAVCFTQVVQTRKGNFILVHTIYKYIRSATCSTVGVLMYMLCTIKAYTRLETFIVPTHAVWVNWYCVSADGELQCED